MACDFSIAAIHLESGFISQLLFPRLRSSSGGSERYSTHVNAPASFTRHWLMGATPEQAAKSRPGRSSLRLPHSEAEDLSLTLRPSVKLPARRQPHDPAGSHLTPIAIVNNKSDERMARREAATATRTKNGISDINRGIWEAVNPNGPAGSPLNGATVGRVVSGRRDKGPG
ncbi:hypothetical protein SKAU_G00202930 [Synaphobranchus kaupii]|uniref:Uncharacterized protein n=1 Tax=Synaphobranchus kaupii TaxID=118154 RepID=A0A9Q1FFV1_SYNKA|nr:hypothetical protein SKAU_G00202930 [Synaphobranchus kaupii]